MYIGGDREPHRRLVPYSARVVPHNSVSNLCVKPRTRQTRFRACKTSGMRSAHARIWCHTTILSGAETQEIAKKTTKFDVCLLANSQQLNTGPFPALTYVEENRYSVYSTGTNAVAKLTFTSS